MRFREIHHLLVMERFHFVSEMDNERMFCRIIIEPFLYRQSTKFLRWMPNLIELWCISRIDETTA